MENESVTEDRGTNTTEKLNLNKEKLVAVLKFCGRYVHNGEKMYGTSLE